MENLSDPDKIDLAELNEDEIQQWLQEKYPGRAVKRDGDQIVVTIPVNFYRRNGRQIIEAKKSGNDEARKEPDNNETLVNAIAMACAWQKEFESGEYSSIEDLAKAKGVDRSYAGRMLQLTSLAPDIVELVLAGKAPDGVSLRKLRNGIPVLWSQQAHEFLEPHCPGKPGY